MAVFDPELWRTRAWNRYQRAPTSQATTARWTRDITAIGHLQVLVDWCNARSIEINFCKREGGIYYPEDKRIKISGRLSPERQFFFLLHECGHHLIGDKEKNERFGMGYSQDDAAAVRTFHHRVDIVDEELEAWNRGFKLAKRLKLRINKERFDNTRVEMLKTYFKWALRVDGYGGKEDDDDDDDEEAVA